jgi:DNA-binding transcriptional MerR regulator
MSGTKQDFSIEDLAEKSATSVRTIRFYISEGLVPRPVARGKGASYGEEHLLSLRLIRRLSERRVPLAEIRERLAQLSLPDMRALLRAEEQLSAELQIAERAPSAKEYVSALLNRSRLARPATVNRRPSPSADTVTPPLTDALALATRSSPPATAEASAPSAADLLWRRLELAPGVELHLRADAEASSRDLIERLLKQAGRPADRLDRSSPYGAVRSKGDQP